MKACAQSSAVLPQPGGQRPRILFVVDDDSIDRSHVLRFLGDLYDVKAVLDGPAAWDALEARMPDLVLKDAMMPEAGDADIVQKLRDDPARRTLPVIMLTVFDDERSFMEAMDKGANDFIAKPFNPSELLARIAVHLKIARVHREAAEELVKLNVELDRRVAERTEALNAALKALKKEMAGRRRLEKEILMISEREQSRLGQDLHDGLGQELAGIALLAKVHANKLLQEAHADAQTGQNLALFINRTIGTARDLAKGFYPIELERAGLMTALRDHVNRVSKQFAISCQLEHSEFEPQFEKESEIHLYRIVQEAIGNAIKHGSAQRILVECGGWGGAQTISVTNDGNSFHAPDRKSRGMGLHLMEYRARLIGAKLDVKKPSGGGCKVTCTVRASRS